MLRIGGVCYVHVPDTLTVLTDCFCAFPAIETMAVVCLHCNKGVTSNDAINHVGLRSDAPVLTLIEHASTLGMVGLVEKIKEKHKSKIPIYIHVSCRTMLKNNIRAMRSEEPNTCSEMTLSMCTPFDFKSQCFFCEKTSKVDNKNPTRKDYHLVTSLDSIQSKILSICASRDDEFSKSVECRLTSVSDLVAAEARYHQSCRRNFERMNLMKQNEPIADKKRDREQAFEVMCTKLEENNQKYTIGDFSAGMASLNVESFANRTIKLKLISRYGTNISFVDYPGQSSVIVLDTLKYKLVDDWYKNKKLDPKEEEYRIIEMAACIIKTHIRSHVDKSDIYPGVSDILDLSSPVVPQILLDFMNNFTKDPLKKNALAQAIYASCKYHAVLPLQFGLAVSVDNRYSSKWLTILLNKLGFASSYDEIVRFKQNIVSCEKADDIVMYQSDMFLQYVGDNTDHNMDTIDGKNTHHGLGSIIIANGSFGTKPLLRKDVPRNKKLNWSAVQNNEGIPILEYTQQTVATLKTTVFQDLPSLEAFQPNHADLLWVCTKLLKENVPQWSGFMSTFSSESNNAVSAISMLPIIDLNSSDPNALYSLLSFISNQCLRLQIPETSVTFDQPLYVKAYEIVHSRNMNIFMRLGGFHQLMNFLGSIGYLMEGSGLREALETV